MDGPKLYFVMKQEVNFSSVPPFRVSKTLRSVITFFSDEASQFKDFIILINAKGRDNNRLMVFYYDLRSLMKTYVVPIHFTGWMGSTNG